MHNRKRLDTDDLDAWPEVDAAIGTDAALLLGNGASIAVWSGFAYRSLHRAALREVEHPLDEDDVALFREFNTTDFEAVLNGLVTARRVGETLALETIHLRDRYRSIQRALRESVGRAHVTHDAIPASTLDNLRTAYRRYRSVYTTNYDLILYWAILSQPPDPAEFVDFFWGPGVTFDVWQVDVRSATATAVLYLHGAIHLRRTADGIARKETAGPAGNLLDAFSAPMSADETPLFVTEGTTQEKLRRIGSSDYLSFALDHLRDDSRNLVILGHALSGQDEHILKAVNEQPARTVAVGIHAGGGSVRSKKLAFAARLKTADVRFFDASTHPLTAPALAVSAR